MAKISLSGQILNLLSFKLQGLTKQDEGIILMLATQVEEKEKEI